MTANHPIMPEEDCLGACLQSIRTSNAARIKSAIIGVIVVGFSLGMAWAWASVESLWPAWCFVACAICGLPFLVVPWCAPGKTMRFFEKGLIFHCRGVDTSVLWPEVDTVNIASAADDAQQDWCRLWVKSIFANGRRLSVSSLLFSEAQWRVLSDTIVHMTQQHLFFRSISHYRANGRINFGPFICTPGGLEYRGQQYHWRDLRIVMAEDQWAYGTFYGTFFDVERERRLLGQRITHTNIIDIPNWHVFYPLVLCLWVRDGNLDDLDSNLVLAAWATMRQRIDEFLAFAALRANNG